MTLTLEDIKRITFGAVSVTRETDGFHFRRCTERQTEAWFAESEFLGGGSLCTTGVRLDFYTNSTFLELSASSGNKYELWIDGLFNRQLDMSEFRERGKAARVPLHDRADGNHRVTLWLPSHQKGVIESISLDNGATAEPYRFDMKLLFIGDSITQGWNSRYDSLAYAPIVAGLFNAESLNQGIGGSFFNENAFDRLDFVPDATVVALGTNDFGRRRTASELYDHATAHLSLIKEAFGGDERPIFVISPIWRQVDKSYAMGSFEDCRATVIKAAEALGLIHVDGLTLVPPNPEFFADKTLHPNDLGFSIYARELASRMRPFLVR